MIEVGVVGGTGYTGVELLRLLAAPRTQSVRVITSRAETGTRCPRSSPLARHGQDQRSRFTDPTKARLYACDLVFFATPHGVAMSQARELVGAGVVVDFSADFRLKDNAVWERWYKVAHVRPELFGESVYGLPEMNRDTIGKARMVGNPGCYATAVQLGLLPLVEASIVDPRTSSRTPSRASPAPAARPSWASCSARRPTTSRRTTSTAIAIIPRSCRGFRTLEGAGAAGFHSTSGADGPRHPRDAVRAHHRQRRRLPGAVREALRGGAVRRRPSAGHAARNPLCAGHE